MKKAGITLLFYACFLIGCNSSEPNSPPTVLFEDLTAPEKTNFDWPFVASDPEGEEILLDWKQVSGPSVAVNRFNNSALNITTPAVVNDTVAVFEITATDSKGNKGTAEAEITIKANMKDVRLVGYIDSSINSTFEVTAVMAGRTANVTTDEDRNFTVSLAIDDSEIEQAVKLSAISTKFEGKIEFSSEVSGFSHLLQINDLAELSGNSFNALNLSNVSTAVAILSDRLRSTRGQLPYDSVPLTDLRNEKILHFASLHFLANKFIAEQSPIANGFLDLTSSQLLQNDQSRNAFTATLQSTQPRELLADTRRQVHENHLKNSQPLETDTPAIALFEVTDDPRSSGRYIRLNQEGSGTLVGDWLCRPFNDGPIKTTQIEWNEDPDRIELNPTPELPYIGSFYPPQPIYTVNVEARQHLISRELAILAASNGQFLINQRENCLGVFVDEPGGQDLLDDVPSEYYALSSFVDRSKIVDPENILEVGTVISIPIPRIKTQSSNQVYFADSITRNAEIEIKEINGEHAAVEVTLYFFDIFGSMVKREYEGYMHITEKSSLVVSVADFKWDVTMLDTGRNYQYVSVLSLDPNESIILDASSGMQLIKGDEISFDTGIYALDLSHESRLNYFAIEFKEDGSYSEIYAIDNNNDGVIDSNSEVNKSSGLWKQNADGLITTRIFRHIYSQLSLLPSENYCMPESFDTLLGNSCVLYQERVIRIFETNVDHLFTSTSIRQYMNFDLPEAMEYLILDQGYIDNRAWRKVDELPFEVPNSPQNITNSAMHSGINL